MGERIVLIINGVWYRLLTMEMWVSADGVEWVKWVTKSGHFVLTLTHPAPLIQASGRHYPDLTVLAVCPDQPRLV